jgi:predicted nucleic acid-binding protein
VQEAKLLKDKPLLVKEHKSSNLLLNKKEYSLCKEALNINSIANSLDRLNLRYKLLDEVDIYNIIEDVLATNRKV